MCISQILYIMRNDETGTKSRDCNDTRSDLLNPYMLCVVNESLKAT